MKFSSYMNKRKRTEIDSFGKDKSIEVATLGFFGETGEVVDLFKKILFHGHPMAQEKEKLKYEMGDCVWYLGSLLHHTKLKRNLKRRLMEVRGLTDNKLDIIDILELDTRWEDGFYSKTNIKEDIFELISLSFSVVATLKLIMGNEQREFENNLIVFHLSEYLTLLNKLIVVSGNTLEEVLEGNIEKLNKRYPDGFRETDSILRESPVRQQEALIK